MAEPMVKSLQGNLLVAAPQLLDPNFVRTVVLMVQHDENGALGLVLNRPLKMTLSHAWKKVSEKPCHRDDKLHVGGPVEGPLMVVHTHEPTSQISLGSGLFFTAEPQDIEWIVADHEGPARFFVGYAGWSAGQLEKEMGTGSWLTAPGSFDKVLESDEALWLEVLREIDPALALLLSNRKIAPQDPSLN